VRLRAIRPVDADRLIDLFDRLSPRTVYRRFFTYMRRLPPAWAQKLAAADDRRRFGLVAERDTPQGGGWSLTPAPSPRGILHIFHKSPERRGPSAGRGHPLDQTRQHTLTIEAVEIASK
jgi:hypothetical protein